jgi:Flp pilus assembly protein TadD
LDTLKAGAGLERRWRRRARLARLFSFTSLFACVMLLAANGFQAPAQSAARYQQTLLAIQQQIQAGNLDQARAAINAASKTYPADGGLENLLGVVEIQQGHADAARVQFSAAIRHAPRLVSALMNLSRLDMSSAATDKTARAEALRLSLNVLRLDSKNDEANYQVATISNWNHDSPQSLEYLERLSAQASVQVSAQALVCAAHAALGPASATDAAAVALAANADLTEPDADTCIPALRAAHRADLIESLLAAVATHQPLSPSGVRMLGLAEEAEGKLPAARATLEAAFAADPQSAVVLADLTRVAKTSGDNQGALGYLAHARELSPNDPSLPYEFAVICVDMGLYAEARKALAEALRLAPDNPDYNLGMGIVVSFSEDPSQSLPFLARFHQLRPSDPQGVLALGAANFRAKDYEIAAKFLHQAATDKATAADALFYLGVIARQEGRLDEAIAELKQSLALHPGQADALAELGQISALNHNTAEAQSYFDQALKLDPGSYAANFGLLQLYARTSDPRREEQAKRFDQIKDEKEERDRQMMRSIEIRRDPDAIPGTANTGSNQN